MKTLIVYAGQTGNTRKLAEALNNLLGGEKTLPYRSCTGTRRIRPDHIGILVAGRQARHKVVRVSCQN